MTHTPEINDVVAYPEEFLALTGADVFRQLTEALGVMKGDLLYYAVVFFVHSNNGIRYPVGAAVIPEHTCGDDPALAALQAWILYVKRSSYSQVLERWGLGDPFFCSSEIIIYSEGSRLKIVNVEEGCSTEDTRLLLNRFSKKKKEPRKRKWRKSL